MGSELASRWPPASSPGPWDRPPQPLRGPDVTAIQIMTPQNTAFGGDAWWTERWARGQRACDAETAAGLPPQHPPGLVPPVPKRWALGTQDGAGLYSGHSQSRVELAFFHLELQEGERPVGGTGSVEPSVSLTRVRGSYISGGLGGPVSVLDSQSPRGPDASHLPLLQLPTGAELWHQTRGERSPHFHTSSGAAPRTVPPGLHTTLRA